MTDPTATDRLYHVVIGRAPTDDTVHLIRTARHQNGAFRMTLCGRHQRTYRVTRPVDCKRCLREADR